MLSSPRQGPGAGCSDGYVFFSYHAGSRGTVLIQNHALTIRIIPHHWRWNMGRRDDPGITLFHEGEIHGDPLCHRKKRGKFFNSRQIYPEQ
jgi:hypothetical protein